MGSNTSKSVRNGENVQPKPFVEDIRFLNDPHVEYRRSRSDPFYKDFEDRYKDLDKRKQLCLFCFAIFPENAEVKKRLLRYWWIGERLIKEEDEANYIIQIFLKQGFIEPVTRRSGLQPISYKVHPIFRPFLIWHAKMEKFFDFDLELTEPTNNISKSKKSCLIESETISHWLISESENSNKAQQQRDGRREDLEDLQTLFNVSKQYADIPKKTLSLMINVGVLYLGIWGNTDEIQLEVENWEFLKGLKDMKELRFLSLHGVSGISKLPRCLRNLTNLRILDLKACHSLVKLSNQIGSLKKLTHLDLSRCYLLESLPKQLCKLSNLKVLKGFILNRSHHSCTLKNLQALTKLEKLSIKVDDDNISLEKMRRDLARLSVVSALKILKIAWTAWNWRDVEISQQNFKVQGLKHFQRLEKLDLKCYPGIEPPKWLDPENLTNLKRLYIRGGNFISLAREHSDNRMQWNVQILRLRYLYDLKMDWKELQMRFPEMTYLEKVNCPQITFCPCDANGIWSKETTGVGNFQKGGS